MPTLVRPRLPETLLSLIALGAALHYAQGVAAPLTLAIVAAMLLSPVHRWINRHGVGPAAAAALTLLITLAALVALAALLRPWVNEAIEAWPQMKSELRGAMFDLRLQLSGLFDIQREVIEAIDPGSSTAADDGQSAIPTLADAAWLAPRVLGQALIFVGGVFFFLLGRDELYDHLARRLGQQGSGVRPEEFVQAEALVARYFGTVTMINLGFGLAVALLLSLIGMPGAPVWGAIAALANFVVYLGPALAAGALVFAGTVAFDGIAALLPAAIFVSLNVIEGQFVTPMILGRHMRLNPFLVFVSIAFWLWLWGPIGGIVAIPLLLWLTALWPPSAPRRNPLRAQMPPDHGRGRPSRCRAPRDRRTPE
jgi:predicted PurR-regulated permease PerM